MNRTKRSIQGVEAQIQKYLPSINLYAHRLAVPLLLLFAFFYYGIYYRSGLNLGGEGGTVAVVAQRLMEGQRPIADVFLGYNLLWFYPVVWLFKIFGPNYIALRIFFFALCTVTGLLTYRVIWRVTGQPLYALLAGILVLYVPGMLFRNYMGFLGLLNMLVLLEAYVLSQKTTLRQVLWIAAAGGALSLTFLVRVDLGFFMLLLHAALLLVYPIGVRGKFLSRLGMSALAAAATAVIFLLTHLPFYLDAKSGGFEENFVGQYLEIPNMLRHQLEIYLTEGKKAPQKNAAIPENLQVSSVPVTNDVGTRPRPLVPSFGSISSRWDRLLAISLYFPVLLLAIILPAFAGKLLWALWKSDMEGRTQALSVLAATGCALAFFPQYYFFRPDLPHLSEFMCSFLPALGICIYFGFGYLRDSSRSALRILLGGFLALAITDAAIYLYYADKKPSAGTAAAKNSNPVEFRGENHVSVLLPSEEVPDIKGLYDAIMSHSGPEDYLICYPYSPTVNFMTNRRTYLHNLYVDNATISAGRFYRETTQEISKYQPAIILIDNRAINKTEGSRFSQWAAETYKFIRTNYRLVGTFGTNEVYVRPDKVQTTNHEKR